MFEQMSFLYLQNPLYERTDTVALHQLLLWEQRSWLLWPELTQLFKYFRTLQVVHVRVCTRLSICALEGVSQSQQQKSSLRVICLHFMTSSEGTYLSFP